MRTAPKSPVAALALLTLLAVTFAAPLTAQGDAAPQDGTNGWRELEPGLSFREFQITDDGMEIAVLRIDPARFAFTLFASSLDGRPARTLREWGEQYDLTAAINASMYLPDGKTSTGYLRQGEHVNNKRMVQRFGAFFVAGPDRPDLPEAAILNRDAHDWREMLPHYALVIQNYRMIDNKRHILWSPGGPMYSISAVGEDGTGHILFLHCREPVEAHAFAQHLLRLPLDVRTVMYVEGGGQAGLLVRSRSLRRELAGKPSSPFFVTGNLRAPLPNVLGVRAKQPHADSIPPY